MLQWLEPLWIYSASRGGRRQRGMGRPPLRMPRRWCGSTSSPPGTHIPNARPSAKRTPIAARPSTESTARVGQASRYLSRSSTPASLCTKHLRRGKSLTWLLLVIVGLPTSYHHAIAWPLPVGHRRQRLLIGRLASRRAAAGGARSCCSGLDGSKGAGAEGAVGGRVSVGERGHGLYEGRPGNGGHG